MQRKIKSFKGTLNLPSPGLVVSSDVGDLKNG